MRADAERFNGLDLLRVACVFAVVWIHGCDTSALALRLSGIAGFAVPVFILMSVFLLQLSILKKEQRCWRETLIKRLWRLLPAYILWSLIYLGVRQAKHMVMGASLSTSDWGLALLTGGASYQLYFVAAMIYWTVLLSPLFFRGKANSITPSILLVVLAGMLFWGGALLHSEIEFSSRSFIWSQMLKLTGYVPLAMALSRLWFLFGRNRVGGLWRHRVGVLFLVLGAGWMIFRVPFGRPFLPSICLLIGGVLFNPPELPRIIQSLSRLSYGVFLVHGFFVEGGQMVATRMGWPLEHFLPTLGIILFSFFCSTLLCWQIFRIRKLRWAVG